jgi:hypothetical protein
MLKDDPRNVEEPFAPTFYRFSSTTVPGRDGIHVLAYLGSEAETIGIVLPVDLAFAIAAALRSDLSQSEVRSNYRRGRLPPLSDQYLATEFELKQNKALHLRFGANGKVLIEFAMPVSFAAEFAMGLDLTAGDICQQGVAAP